MIQAESDIAGRPKIISTGIKSQCSNWTCTKKILEKWDVVSYTCNNWGRELWVQGQPCLERQASFNKQKQNKNSKGLCRNQEPQLRTSLSWSQKISGYTNPHLKFQEWCPTHLGLCSELCQGIYSYSSYNLLTKNYQTIQPPTWFTSGAMKHTLVSFVHYEVICHHIYKILLR